MTLNPEFAFPALWNPCLRTGTMILIVHLVMCELPHLPQFWWSDTLTAGVLMQWRVGRDTGVFEIPRVHLNRFWSCIYICIKLLNLRPGLLNYTTRIKSAHSAGCRDVAISPWYHEAGHWRWLDYTQVSPMMCAAWEPGAWHYFQILS